MNQQERRIYLIKELLKERNEEDALIPEDEIAQKRLLRGLMNVRMAAPISKEFEEIQDAYLKQANAEKGIVSIEDMKEYKKDIYIWQGDITRLKVGAIVNAANSGMTGCYIPCHDCIDNFIQTYAGIQLRNTCDRIMKEQGFEEPTGEAKITPAYNLPSDYVIHTVGPIVYAGLDLRHIRQLESCYKECLKIAVKNNVESIAFCCISTGVFMFPNQEAAEIAVKTVDNFKKETGSDIKVIFNVFKDKDLHIYEQLLS